MYLELKNLYKGFDREPVVEDLNLSLDKGELLCILGGSGSVFLDGVCHPRPGGGFAAVGQDGHYGAGASGAVRPAGGNLPQPGNPLRWGISQPVQPALGSRWYTGKDHQAGLTNTGRDSAQAINDRRWLWKSSLRRFFVKRLLRIPGNSIRKPNNVCDRVSTNPSSPGNMEPYSPFANPKEIWYSV